ncbi:MAG: methyl-accepting chemotaxis protein [Limnochordia bacterium]|jgi:methyl-accepting chemotaxis protein
MWRNLGVRSKLFVAILLGFLLFSIAVSSYMLSNQGRLLQTMITDSLEANKTAVENQLTQRAEQALGISLTVASMPDIVAATKTQDRSLALEILVPIYQAVHEQFGVDVLHLRAPYNTSLARGQNPAVYGDVQNRLGFVDAARTGQPRSGFDRGPFGMGMRGWAPVFYNDEVVGTVETNIAFTAEFLNQIQAVLGPQLAVFVPENEGYNLLTATSAAVGKIKPTSHPTGEFHTADNLAYTFLPVVSYEGEELAVIGIYEDVTPYRQLITRQTSRLLLLLIFSGLAFILLLGALLKGTLAPLQDLATAAQVISTGDLQVALPEIQTRDEIGSLVDAFGQMTKSLRDMIGSISRIIDDTTAASKQLAASTEQSSASIRGISDTADDFAATIERMTAIAATAETISQMATEGKGAIDEAVNGTQELRDNVLTLTGFVTNLEQRSQEIGRIIEVINDIADQTNLLALNASIEAARAGEQGRGFAVVAEEIRQLAERSAQATTEIDELIATIQEETKQAALSMGQGADQAEETSTIVGTSGQVLNDILQAVEDMGRQVAAAAGNIEEISRGSQEITAYAEEQSTVIEEVAHTSRELRAMAEDLQDLVGRFRIG